MGEGERPRRPGAGRPGRHCRAPGRSRSPIRDMFRRSSKQRRGGAARAASDAQGGAPPGGSFRERVANAVSGNPGPQPQPQLQPQLPPSPSPSPRGSLVGVPPLPVLEEENEGEIRASPVGSPVKTPLPPAAASLDEAVVGAPMAPPPRGDSPASPLSSQGASTSSASPALHPRSPHGSPRDSPPQQPQRGHPDVGAGAPPAKRAKRATFAAGSTPEPPPRHQADPRDLRVGKSFAARGVNAGEKPEPSRFMRWFQRLGRSKVKCVFTLHVVGVAANLEDGRQVKVTAQRGRNHGATSLLTMRGGATATDEPITLVTTMYESKPSGGFLGFGGGKETDRWMAKPCAIAVEVMGAGFKGARNKQTVGNIKLDLSRILPQSSTGYRGATDVATVFLPDPYERAAEGHGHRRRTRAATAARGGKSGAQLMASFDFEILDEERMDRTHAAGSSAMAIATEMAASTRRRSELAERVRNNPQASFQDMRPSRLFQDMERAGKDMPMTPPDDASDATGLTPRDSTGSTSTDAGDDRSAHEDGAQLDVAREVAIRRRAFEEALVPMMPPGWSVNPSDIPEAGALRVAADARRPLISVVPGELVMETSAPVIVGGPGMTAGDTRACMASLGSTSAAAAAIAASGRSGGSGSMQLATAGGANALSLVDVSNLELVATKASQPVVQHLGQEKVAQMQTLAVAAVRDVVGRAHAAQKHAALQAGQAAAGGGDGSASMGAGATSSAVAAAGVGMTDLVRPLQPGEMSRETRNALTRAEASGSPNAVHMAMMVQFHDPNAPPDAAPVPTVAVVTLEPHARTRSRRLGSGGTEEEGVGHKRGRHREPRVFARKKRAWWKVWEPVPKKHIYSKSELAENDDLDRATATLLPDDDSDDEDTPDAGDNASAEIEIEEDADGDYRVTSVQLVGVDMSGRKNKPDVSGVGGWGQSSAYTRAHGARRAQFSSTGRGGGRQKSEKITVMPGDTLWSLSAVYCGGGPNWTELYERNPDIENPDLIFAYNQMKVH